MELTDHPDVTQSLWISILDSPRYKRPKNQNRSSTVVVQLFVKGQERFFLLIQHHFGPKISQDTVQIFSH